MYVGGNLSIQGTVVNLYMLINKSLTNHATPRNECLISAPGVRI